MHSNYSEILLDEHVKEKITSAAKVAGIAAVLSLLSAIIGLVVIFFFPPEMKQLEGFNNQLMRSTSLFSSFISFAITVIMFYFLYRFASQSRAGIQQNNPAKLESGMSGLANYFKAWYIFIMIIITFIVIISIALILGVSSGK